MAYKIKRSKAVQQENLKTRLKKYADDLAQANRQLQDKDHQVEFIIDHIPALISYVDAAERYRFCNKLYENWFGVKKEDLYGKTLRQVRGKEIYKTIKPFVKKALSGKQVTYDNVLRKQDGSCVYFTATYAPHISPEGKVLGFFILATDITERKRAEEKLKETEDQFRQLVDANVIGMIITVGEGPIVEANDVFLQMVGYTRADLLAGKVNWLKMTPPEYLPITQKNEKKLITEGVAAPFEKEYIRKDGSRVAVLVGDVLLDKATRKTIAFILDITKQKELNQRKDEFIALASHELKTPLTSLKMYAQLIYRTSQKLKDEQSARLLANMDGQIDKLTELVNDLLDVSRIEAGKLQYKKETFAFDKLVKETIEDLQRVSESHTLIIKGETQQKVKADRYRIKQVLTNLITNAGKYSPQADKVVITLKNTTDSVEVQVRDYGIGIPREQQSKIFDRFFQADRPLSHTYSGLGLGLYISKEIIDRHKGKIWVKSNKDKGTSFFFSLPLRKKRNKMR